MTDDGLTDAAKKEIADAIRIVREDRFERYVRERLAKNEAAPTPDKPVTDAPVPPPPVPADPQSEPEPPTPKKRGLYWGDAEE